MIQFVSRIILNIFLIADIYKNILLQKRFHESKNIHVSYCVTIDNRFK